MEVLGIWYRRSGVKKLEWWGYRAEKEVWRYLQPRLDTIHQRDRRTDNGRQQRPRLRITSRGNEKVNNKELDVLSGEHFINSGWAFQYSNPQLEHINGPWQLTGRNLPSQLCYVTQFLPALCEMVAVKTKKCRRAKWTPQRLYFPQLVTCETCVTLTLSLSTSTGT